MMFKKDVLAMVVNVVVFLLILLLFSVFVGCRSSHTLTNDIRDSVRYETHYSHEVIYDTVDMYIPHLAEDRLVADSFSFLENEYAKSEAEVRSGYLRHTLETKESVKKVAVVKEIIKQDTIIYKDREVQVERITQKPLPLWQRAILYISPLLIIVCVYLAIRMKWR